MPRNEIGRTFLHHISELPGSEYWFDALTAIDRRINADACLIVASSLLPCASLYLSAAKLANGLTTVPGHNALREPNALFILSWAAFPPRSRYTASKKHRSKELEELDLNMCGDVVQRVMTHSAAAVLVAIPDDFLIADSSAGTTASW